MTKATTKKKLAVLGNGFLAGIIVGAYNKGLLEEYELTGILGRTKEKTELYKKFRLYLNLLLTN